MRNLLLGIVGTIICVGGVAAIQDPSLILDKNNFKKNVESKFIDFKNLFQSKKNIDEELEMISIQDAIEGGYTSETFNLEENISNKDNRKIDISGVKPFMDKGLSFDEARAKLVKKKMEEATIVSL